MLFFATCPGNFPFTLCVDKRWEDAPAHVTGVYATCSWLGEPDRWLLDHLGSHHNRGYRRPTPDLLCSVRRFLLTHTSDFTLSFEIDCLYLTLCLLSHVFFRKKGCATFFTHLKGCRGHSGDSGPKCSRNRRAQIARKLRKIAASSTSNHTFNSRDLWFGPLFKSPLKSQCQFPVQQDSTLIFSERSHTVSNR